MTISFCFSNFDLLVEIDFQPGASALEAHQESLLQFLQVLSIQVLSPVKEVFPHNLSQDLVHLHIGKNDPLAVGRFRHKGALLKDLEETMSNNKKTVFTKFRRKREPDRCTSMGFSRRCLRALAHMTCPTTCGM